MVNQYKQDPKAPKPEIKKMPANLEDKEKFDRLFNLIKSQDETIRKLRAKIMRMEGRVNSVVDRVRRITK